MSEQDPKGFRIVDKRGMKDVEPETEETAASPPPQPGDAGNRPAPESVDTGKRPEHERSAIGSPTFLDLVMSLQMGAMVNLGMVQSSDGRRPPVNLPAAKDSIDLLDVLKEKTRGNLSEEEAGVLAEGLYHLRMAYVEAVNAGASPPTGGQGRGGKQT